VILVCHYCGHTSTTMVEAARHEATRPESCAAVTYQLNRLSVTGVESTLRTLTVRGGGNLDQTLDEYYDRIERVYR
jgi:hypothetical protein